MKDWTERLLDALAEREHFGYGSERVSAAEPAALAAMALMAHGRMSAAQRPLQWLAEAQQRSGAVGTRGGAMDPRWTTSLAMLAWRQAIENGADPDQQLAARVLRATANLLSLRGKRGEPGSDSVGHDVSLVAWSWVEGTHSWIEPTALAVLALRAEGLADHPRTREAVRMLLDRQLPGGGCNYGNTTVLGQVLRPHPQPSAMALVALAGEPPDTRIDAGCAYLREVCEHVTASVSMSWVMLGLATYGQRPADADQRLASAFAEYDGRSCPAYIAALLAHAQLGEHSPLIQLPRRASSSADAFTGADSASFQEVLR